MIFNKKMEMDFGSAQMTPDPDNSAKCQLVVCTLLPLKRRAYAFAKVSRKGFCRNPRGIFPNKVPGEFRRGLFGGFFRAFFLGKQATKIHGKIRIRTWEFRGQNPHCKNLALKKCIAIELGGVSQYLSRGLG